MDSQQFKNIPISSSEITPESVFLSRRQFMQQAALAAAGLALAACDVPAATAAPAAAQALTAPPRTTASVDELGAPLTPFDSVTHYNNFYEFTTDKQGVADLVDSFKPAPWTLEVSGLVQNPRTFGLEDLLKLFPSQERIYRLRCVEGWSMVIPWLGFPLAQLLKSVQPLGSARFVRFESVLRPQELPGQRSPLYPWPYQEGLRLDEALNDLTLLSTGLYGQSLPSQNGAPIRLVVPWKYGFKSIKSVVKIELVEKQPATLWSSIAPDEYGFYANVNPNKDHPRWSQASERRIGEFSRRETLLFNGYGAQVADLYRGMDLNVDY